MAGSITAAVAAFFKRNKTEAADIPLWDPMAPLYMRFTTPDGVTFTCEKIGVLKDSLQFKFMARPANGEPTYGRLDVNMGLWTDLDDKSYEFVMGNFFVFVTDYYKGRYTKR